MSFTGFTCIIYGAPIYHELLQEIRKRGFDTVRFISHDQTCQYNGGNVVWTPWMQIGKDICNQHDFRMHCTLSPLSIPLDLVGSDGMPNNWVSYEDWLYQYMVLMTVGSNQRTLFMEVGNEFEASGSRWTAAGHKLLWDAAIDARTRFNNTYRNYTIRLGGVGHVVRTDLARFTEMTQYIAPQADFHSIHVYGDASWLDTAAGIIRQYSEAPIWVTECGPDWQPNPVYDNPVAEQAWYSAFLTRCGQQGVSRANMMLGWVDQSDQNVAFLSILKNTFTL